MQKRYIGLIIVFSLLMILFSCNEAELNPEDQHNVALYSETGAWDESLTALKHMFEWMDMKVKQIEAEFVNNNSLEEFDIICFPGGNMYQYSQNLSKEGLNKLKNYVEKGGNYIGICGGAYFAAEEIIWLGRRLPMPTLGLFAGSAQGAIDDIVPYPQLDMCEVVLTDSTHPITKDIPKNQWILYYWGPALKTSDPQIQILGKYAAVDLPAILAFEYGEGKVFLAGTHPEIEEDSQRDGVILPDTTINNVHYLGEEYLEERGSDWIMMKNAVEWLLE